MLLNIAICDDEQSQTDWLKEQLCRWSESRGRNIKITSFSSAEAFLFEFRENKNFDIILLDIEMKEMNGIELAHSLRGENEEIKIIFVTGYAEYIGEGYDVSALHYLLKPVDVQKLFSVLDRASKAVVPARRRLSLTVGRENEFVYVDEILYAESEKHYVVFYTAGSEHRVRMTMPEAEALLGADFCRCGRSFIVGLAHIKRVTKTSVLLRNGGCIPLGKGMFDILNKSLVNYLKEH